MAAPPPGSVIVFLGSDPESVDLLAARPATLTWMSRFLPANLVLGRAEAAEADRSAEGPFPPDQVMCAQRLLDLAKRAHRSVRVVDVNRPGPDRPLVQRYVTENDVLPIAVRADGQRLVGTEGFEPPLIRRFLASA
jgi:hypothetical protein